MKCNSSISDMKRTLLTGLVRKSALSDSGPKIEQKSAFFYSNKGILGISVFVEIPYFESNKGQTPLFVFLY